jgi:hypothetical protein
MKVVLSVLLAVLLLPVVAFAGHSVTITQIDVPGCGPQLVFIHGVSTYGHETQCTRIYSQPDGQGFYTLRNTNCNSPTSWVVPLQFDPGQYLIRARVSTQNNFNAVQYDAPMITVPECQCQP